MRDSCVEGREAICCNAIEGGDGLHCMYSNISLEFFQNPLLMHTTPRITSVTLAMKLAFDRRYNVC